jgi:hypothetical protein
MEGRQCPPFVLPVVQWGEERAPFEGHPGERSICDFGT